MKIDFLNNFRNNIHSLADKILDKIPEDRRRLFIFTLGGLVLLIICLTLVFIMMNGRHARAVELAGVPYMAIPHDELFYPAEPDFLPELMYGREPRLYWTADDLLPFWIDPGPGNEQQWRELASSVIDRLMENVQ